MLAISKKSIKMTFLTTYLLYAFTIIANGKAPHSSLLDSKIVNGIELGTKYYAFVVSLRLHAKHICNGFLVSRRIVITTGYCISEITANDNLHKNVATVLVGTKDLSKRRGKIYAIDHAEPHPQYNSSYPIHTSGYDIGYILVEKRILATNMSVGISLSDKEIRYNTIGKIASWGSEEIVKQNTTFNNVHMSNILKEIDIKITPHFICKNMFSDRVIFPTQMCGKGLKPGESTAWGDEGSPLIKAKKVIGMACTVNRFVGERFPTIFLRASSFYKYIDELKVRFSIEN